MIRSIGRAFLLVGLAQMAWVQAVWAQGLIVDRRVTVPIARSYEIREVSVDARIRDQIAEVQVSQTFHNPGSVQLESEYLFPLPKDGAIQNFVLLVDGKEMPGRLLTKEEARRIYEEIVRSRRDPALLEYMGRGLYRTSVFPIPPGADRKVTMRYNQICKRDREIVEFAYPFSTQKFTAKPIARLSLDLRIESKDPIKSIYSPTSDATIDRSSEHEAKIHLDRRDVIPDRDFRLIYTLSEGAVGASVLSYRPTGSEDGYFLMLASPEIKRADVKPQPKTVIFVLDRSGSMAGKKIEQARKALQFVLANLRDDDLFNIVAYDDRVDLFQPELQRYSPSTRRDAERYVDKIREGGATNIDSALKTAVAMVKDNTRPSYVLFLTDGLPTAGETNELKIAENSRGANASHVKIFSFGVGYDVNARLLDRLSGGNQGTSEYVKPDEDIEAHVARFYSKLTSPILTDIKVAFGETDINRTYPRDIPDLFEGGQLILVGRYRQGGKTSIKVNGKVGGDSRQFDFSTELASSDRGGSYDFIERIWATRRVGAIIDQIDLHGQNKELIDELVALSQKYGILTPYTSFLADETVPLHAATENRARAARSLDQLSVVSGAAGVNQRSAKQFYMEAKSVGDGQAPTAYSPALSNAGQSKGAMAGMQPQPRGAMMGGLGRMAGQSADKRSADRRKAGPVLFAEAFEPQGQAASNALAVRQAGSKTFYRRQDRWVDSTVTPEEDLKAKVIRQFSDEYFELARSQKAEFNQYLAFEEPVTIKLDDQVYRFDPPTP
ncbi:VIT domain-containing protein [Singulisphaera sp. PoT]|uniref:VIT domain-containing protein n=1 Tax=Singulisphaera sp. PoT TaxID=3411797 RepID=UPI003BF50AEE